MATVSFEETVAFHGHACPGLAFGYRVALAAMDRLAAGRSTDEELVAVVENNSCALDAIQVVAGCTFGKGNLIFKDYGKQVYTFFRRSDGLGLRIAVSFSGPQESERDREMWRRHLAGDASDEVSAAVRQLREMKMRTILDAPEEELFSFGQPLIPMPEAARIFPVLLCERCGEKVMAPKTVKEGSRVLCFPCAEAERQKS